MVAPQDLPAEKVTFFQPGSARAHALAQYFSYASSPWRMTTKPCRSPAADSCVAAASSADWERPWAPGVDGFHGARPGPGLTGLSGKEMQAESAVVAAADVRSVRRESIRAPSPSARR